VKGEIRVARSRGADGGLNHKTTKASNNSAASFEPSDLPEVDDYPFANRDPSLRGESDSTRGNINRHTGKLFPVFTQESTGEGYFDTLMPASLLRSDIDDLHDSAHILHHHLFQCGCYFAKHKFQPRCRVANTEIIASAIRLAIKAYSIAVAARSPSMSRLRSARPSPSGPRPRMSCDTSLAASPSRVSVATTRDPESFAADAAAIGPTIIPKTLAEAVKADIVFLAVRFEAHPDVAKALPTWQGKTIVDVTNAYGVSPEELGGQPSSKAVAQAFTGARLVKGLQPFGRCRP
jgi:NADP oxidoreductase coenzyme F420-dependent